MTLQDHEIKFERYNWECLETTEELKGILPDVATCFYIDFPGSSVIPEYVEFFKRKRIPYKLLKGDLKVGKRETTPHVLVLLTEGQYPVPAA